MWGKGSQGELVDAVGVEPTHSERLGLQSSAAHHLRSASICLVEDDGVEPRAAREHVYSVPWTQSTLLTPSSVFTTYLVSLGLKVKTFAVLQVQVRCTVSLGRYPHRG